jgi:hypothetical protein
MFNINRVARHCVRASDEEIGRKVFILVTTEQENFLIVNDDDSNESPKY